MSDAQVFDTPDGISYARFVSLKGRLKLEAKGLKFRGGATRPRLATEFGLNPRDSYDAYISHCETQMTILLTKKGSPK